MPRSVKNIFIITICAGAFILVGWALYDMTQVVRGHMEPNDGFADFLKAIGVFALMVLLSFFVR